MELRYDLLGRVFQEFNLDALVIEAVYRIVVTPFAATIIEKLFELREAGFDLCQEGILFSFLLFRAHGFSKKGAFGKSERPIKQSASGQPGDLSESMAKMLILFVMIVRCGIRFTQKLA